MVATLFVNVALNSAAMSVRRLTPKKQCLELRCLNLDRLRAVSTRVPMSKKFRVFIFGPIVESLMGWAEQWALTCTYTYMCIFMYAHIFESIYIYLYLDLYVWYYDIMCDYL